MSYDTFASKTFSKKMGEDSEGENSEEDFDEMIMNFSYFRKQNKSCEPSVICDPLMLDSTNMNENTIILIRKIEENLNKKMLGQKLEDQTGKYSPHECYKPVPTLNETTNKFIKHPEGKIENIQQITMVNNQHSQQTTVVNNQHSQQTTVVNNQHSQQTTVVNNQHSQQDSVKGKVGRSCIKVNLKAKNKFKSFWSPGNAQLLPSKVQNKSVGKPQKNSENVTKDCQNQTIVIEEDLQNPSVIEINTNKLLRDIAKDIEEYKRRALPKLEGLEEPQNKPTEKSVCKDVKIELSTLKKGESKNQMKQEKSNETVDIQTAKVNSAEHKLGFKCLHCNLVFTTLSSRKKHSRVAHRLIIKCPDCNLKFNSKTFLLEHQKIAHVDFFCRICNKKCKNLDGLNSHNRAKHRNV